VNSKRVRFLIQFSG